MIIFHIIFSILTFSITKSIAILFFYWIFYFLGLFITRNSQAGSSIFSRFFLIYTIYASLVYTYKIYYGLEFVHASDQVNFYLQSEDLGSMHSFWLMFKRCFKMVLVDWNGGSALIFGTISYTAKSLFDGNHFLLHLYSVCFATSISLFYLFKTLTFYFNPSKSINYTIIFGFFSYLFYYSGFMLRDVFIALLHMMAIYTYHEEKLKFKTIIKFLILALFTYSLRNENGIFILLFPFIYVLKTKLTAKKNIMLASILILLFFISGVLVTTYYNALESMNSYTEYNSERINDLEESSLITYLDKLPIVIREISLIGFKLISPFPFWDFIKGKFANIIFLNVSLAGIFSYYLNGFVFLSIIFFRKHIVINKSLIYLTIIAYLLFIGNLASLDTRRMFYVYPIIFILFLKLYNQIKNKSGINSILTYIYALLTIIYLSLKI